MKWNNSYSVEEFDNWQQCKTCHGTGQNNKGEICPDCLGNGETKIK